MKKLLLNTRYKRGKFINWFGLGNSGDRGAPSPRTLNQWSALSGFSCIKHEFVDGRLCRHSCKCMQALLYTIVTPSTLVGARQKLLFIKAQGAHTHHRHVHTHANQAYKITSFRPSLAKNNHKKSRKKFASDLKKINENCAITNFVCCGQVEFWCINLTCDVEKGRDMS